MPNIIERLAPGSRRQLGAANEIAAEVARQISLLPELLESTQIENDLIKMRAYDALEKALRANSKLDNPETREALIKGLTHEWWEVRIQCIRAVGLCTWDRPSEVAEQIKPLLNDPAKFVRAWAVDTAVLLALQDQSLYPWAEDVIQQGLESQYKSVVKRAQKSARILRN
jgi:HEAT repeat protein